MRKKFFMSLATVCTCLLTSCCHNNGAVCFTFDDFGGDNWVKADKIFKKYNAHATFLIAGNPTDKLDVMKKLQDAGHSVGLHTVKHTDAVTDPQLLTPEEYFSREVKKQWDFCRANGINVTAFAFPNNRHNEEFDQFFFQYFDFLRVGSGPAKKPIFIPMDQVGKKMLLQGYGIGKFYKSDLTELKKILDHAAETNSMIVFFSHSIYPNAPSIHMPSEWLEELLQHASQRKMRIIGANEIK